MGKEATYNTLFICSDSNCNNVLATTQKKIFYAKKQAVKCNWRFDKDKVYCENH